MNSQANLDSPFHIGASSRATVSWLAFLAVILIQGANMFRFCLFKAEEVSVRGCRRLND